MKIAHISDLHFNIGNDFNERIYGKAVKILNETDFDFVFISGDITTNGILKEYELAEDRLKEINGKKIIIPGNHDERNLGFKLFPEFFGKTDFIHSHKNINLVGLASSEPDRDDGRLGRARHKLITQAVKKDKITIIGLHHHLIPVPNSGRETNIIEDAGETLDIILKNKIPLVLMGHRHVPWAVKIHKSLLVNAGTFSCTRTRAYFGNTFNFIDIGKNKTKIYVININKMKKEKMIEFFHFDGSYENKYY